MGHADPDRKPPSLDKSRFWRLLPYYFIGAAIGCVLVGAILSAKRGYLRPPNAATSPAAPRSMNSEPGSPEAPGGSAK
jgi:hypothetical protein